MLEICGHGIMSYTVPLEALLCYLYTVTTIAFCIKQYKYKVCNINWSMRWLSNMPWQYLLTRLLLQDVEELVEEVQEARRIKLLHQPSKVHWYCPFSFVMADGIFMVLSYYCIELTHGGHYKTVDLIGSSFFTSCLVCSNS
jgi:hypothetical protein